MHPPQLDYLTINRHHWDTRLETHLASAFYDMPAFEAGATSLKRYELELLGDVRDRKLLHLQCHFGQDTLSLARMGAHVTGLDFSEKTIDTARHIATRLGIPARFVCANVYDAADAVGEMRGQYDTVFTSYGTIGWLPDLTAWATAIYDCLRVGGDLVFVEFHPVVWMFDDDFTHVHYSYFNDGHIHETSEGSYTDPVGTVSPIRSEYVTWNHDLAEVFTALLAAGFTLTAFREHASSPYDNFRHNTPTPDGMFQIPGYEGKLPIIYSLRAVKNAR